MTDHNELLFFQSVRHTIKRYHKTPLNLTDEQIGKKAVEQMKEQARTTDFERLEEEYLKAKEI